MIVSAAPGGQIPVEEQLLFLLLIAVRARIKIPDRCKSVGVKKEVYAPLLSLTKVDTPGKPGLESSLIKINKFFGFPGSYVQILDLFLDGDGRVLLKQLEKYKIFGTRWQIAGSNPIHDLDFFWALSREIKSFLSFPNTATSSGKTTQCKLLMTGTWLRQLYKLASILRDANWVFTSYDGIMKHLSSEFEKDDRFVWTLYQEWLGSSVLEAASS